MPSMICDSDIKKIDNKETYNISSFLSFHVKDKIFDFRRIIE